MQKSLAEINTILKEHRAEICQKYNIKEIGIFGSYVRGEQQQQSDIDILVEFTEPIGLFEFVHLKNLLSELLGNNVDLVMKTAIKPKAKQNILQETIYV
jgi:uncharacterized protein